MAQPGYEGWGALGEVLGGGGGTPGTYEKTIKEAYSADKALQDARRARSLSIIDGDRATRRQGLTPELMQRMAAGDQTAQAEVMSIVLGGNSTMNMGQLGDYQQPLYGQASMMQAEGLGMLGDETNIPMANKAAAYLKTKAYQPTVELGGAYMADGADVLGGDSFIPTLPTMTRQNQVEASIGQGQQRVDIARGKAASGGSAGGKPPTTAQSEARVLAEARKAIAEGADPAMVAARLREKGYAPLAGKVYAAPKPGAGE